MSSFEKSNSNTKDETNWEEQDFPGLNLKKSSENDDKKSFNEMSNNEENDEKAWEESESTFVDNNTGDQRFSNVQHSCDPLVVNASSEELKEKYNEKSISEFDELGISQELLRGIVSVGFERPSPVQRKAILPFLDGHDVIAQAQSGTGKTATFLISVLQKIDPSINGVQAFVISHTHELADQTYKIFNNFARFTEIKALLCSGSEDKDNTIKELSSEKKPHVLICTPGRLNHMISQNYFSRRHVRMMMLDEADELFKRNFYDQIYNIYEGCYNPENIQIGMYSATMPEEMQRLMMHVVRQENFVHIKVEQEKLTLDGITQWFKFFKRPSEKQFLLIDIFESGIVGQVIIYCNRKEQTNLVARILCNEGFSAVPMNSDLKPHERKEVMNKFRTGTTRVLVCTNMLARGIDVQQVSLVINFDFPNSQACENYLHRVGRSGRFGRKGYAISFVTHQDESAIREVEGFYKFNLIPLPENYASVISKS